MSEDQNERKAIINDWRELAEALVKCEEDNDGPAWDCNNCKNFPTCYQYTSYIMSCVCTFIANLIEGSSGSLSSTLANMVKDATDPSQNKKDMTLYS